MELFEEVCSQDFLHFKFGERGYQDQLYDSIAKTGRLAGVRVELIDIPLGEGDAKVRIVWVQHDFGFLGGSLGCAEGEKITRAFEYALEHKLAVCVQVFCLALPLPPHILYRCNSSIYDYLTNFLHLVLSYFMKINHNLAAVSYGRSKNARRNFIAHADGQGFGCRRSSSPRRSSFYICIV